MWNVQLNKKQLTGVVTDNFFSQNYKTNRKHTKNGVNLIQNHKITNKSIGEYYMNRVNQQNKCFSEKDKYYESQNWDDLFAYRAAICCHSRGILR